MRPRTYSQTDCRQPANNGAEEVLDQLIRTGIQRDYEQAEPPANSWRRLHYNILAEQMADEPITPVYRKTYWQPLHFSIRDFAIIPRTMESILAIMLVLLIAAPTLLPGQLGPSAGSHSAQHNPLAAVSMVPSTQALPLNSEGYTAGDGPANLPLKNTVQAASNLAELVNEEQAQSKVGELVERTFLAGQPISYRILSPHEVFVSE